MKLFDTIMGSGESEQVIERSRFLSYARYVETREEADEFLQEIRSLHPNATHHVPAFVIGEHSEIQWASDNGEPQGTAGAPMLHVLTASGLTNTALVVVRYFGGIKLGTGGLVRAYSSAARSGIRAAGIGWVEESAVIPCETDYASYNRVCHAGFPEGTTVQNPVYAERVSFSLVTEEGRAAETMALLKQITSGKIRFGVIGKARRKTAYPEKESPLRPR